MSRISGKVQWPDTTGSKIKIVMQYGGTPPRVVSPRSRKKYGYRPEGYSDRANAEPILDKLHTQREGRDRKCRPKVEPSDSLPAH